MNEGRFVKFCMRGELDRHSYESRICLLTANLISYLPLFSLTFSFVYAKYSIRTTSSNSFWLGTVVWGNPAFCSVLRFTQHFFHLLFFRNTYLMFYFQIIFALGWYIHWNLYCNNWSWFRLLIRVFYHFFRLFIVYWHIMF